MFETLYEYYNRLTEAILITLKIKKKVTNIEKKLKKKLKVCRNELPQFQDSIGLHLSEEEYKEVEKEAVEGDNNIMVK